MTLGAHILIQEPAGSRDCCLPKLEIAIARAKAIAIAVAIPLSEPFDLPSEYGASPTRNEARRSAYKPNRSITERP